MGNQARLTRIAALREERGLTSDSELLRRLVDDTPLRREKPGPLAGIRLPRGGVALVDLVQDLERRLIEQALGKAGSVTGAARLLRCPRTTLRKKMLALGVTPGPLPGPQGPPRAEGSARGAGPAASAQAPASSRKAS